MIAKITTSLANSNFNFIRARIAEILTLELANQATLQGDDLFNAEVWEERFIPFDKEDLPAITVGLVNVNFEHFTPVTSVGNEQYYIDVHCNAYHTNASGIMDADKKASIKVQRICGIIQAILEHPTYLKLDFDNGVIRHTEVSEIMISTPAEQQDALHTITGRVVFEVSANEIEPDLQPIEADRYTTTVQINETDKGFKYEVIN